MKRHTDGNEYCRARLVFLEDLLWTVTGGREFCAWLILRNMTRYCSVTSPVIHIQLVLGLVNGIKKENMWFMGQVYCILF